MSGCKPGKAANSTNSDHHSVLFQVMRALQRVSQVANMHSAGGRRGQMERAWTPTVNELSNHADFHAARFDLPVYGVRANTNDSHCLLPEYISRNTFISALTSTPRRRLPVKSISSSIHQSN